MLKLTRFSANMHKLPEFEHHAATVSAVRALFLIAMRQLNDTKHTKQAAATAVAPFFAIEFSSRIISDSGRDTLGGILQSGEIAPIAETSLSPSS